ncbi:MAG: hypothetical protein HYZ00_05530 [Candidatus Hydrogenedentes bacterium]|nr:hypothetical protein [Candidatus Hydrogenedentota bacterium]
MDEKHQELSDLVAPKSQTTSRTLPKSTPAFPQITRTVFLIAGIVAGLVILWFGTDFTWAKINEILERRRQLEQPNYTSKAHNMLLAGEPIDRVYKEAAGAVKTTDKEENRQMLEEVRLELIDKVEKILNSPTLDRRGMDSASQWVTLAAELDSDPRVQALAQRVQRDVFAYSMVLVKVDATAGEATFRLNNPQFGVDTQTVKLGELVQDRFLVRAITERSVQLVDSKVETPVGGNRKLIAMPMSVINSM